MTTDASHDYAALAEANLTPVLGRYFQRSWSHGVGHRLYDSDGRAYLDFANGIAVTSLGHAHPRVTAADPRPGRQAHGAGLGARLRGADLTPRDRARGDVPGAARFGDVPQLGLRGHRRRAQARPPGDGPAGHHRVPRRLPRPDATGRPASRPRTSTTGRATSRSCRASTSLPIRSSTPSSRTRPRRRRRASRSCARS